MPLALSEQIRKLSVAIDYGVLGTKRDKYADVTNYTFTLAKRPESDTEEYKSKYLYHRNQLRHGVTGKFSTTVYILSFVVFFVF